MDAIVTETLQDRRARLLGPNMSTFYDEPVHLVRGEGARLWDADGREYLDCYNNVPHVGHCHPVVVQAICDQAGTLNTHTRYLHEGILDYVEALTATFGPNLDTALMCCTGSEANDVALRMAQALTGKTGVIATDHTYHGNTTAVHQLSRSNPPPGGYWDNVGFVPAPDSYRPLGGEAGMAHARAFAAEVEKQIAVLEEKGCGFSTLILCPFFANEGFPDLPAGWLDPTVEVVRRAGGVVIADEVQPGFGRLGTHFWGHEKIGFTPDIVTIGKPMANGHPVAAVVAPRDTMEQFRSNFRYFNTFGGNPVSCAAAMATLRVVQEENLQANAADVGAYAKSGLQELAKRHECIGDVRGSGLFFGAEMVLDRTTREPATAFTKQVANGMRQRGVLLNFLGRHYNVLKMRPPMVFSRANVDQVIETLDTVLAETPLA
ncbi:aminotransferase class III-fold pyridoxal phosphate-dependent enzyme [Lutimaribacter sp. EGI FJ00015]|uniref:Aminotransferase class III-fold pyridoxal phosphate-dependent enzyme n=1 Tax=Lutimaribacter degradans TaxID=2945989 RepID=A0ACC5ZXS3_9RHOB|nr:aminotransferase class III-fold pyridoxal phosphate-dependent enzyme [Lutimaribacter sp. EGI FJ00013]MCM2563137.1 aminotransferase class III-fold pyridoxal phosphate-dependent enzyme [Lutimaribacter sp. EGI FJ00013]MCO0614316.1 aminotransferase class III-fold pyridoxal phosphate-dependent enzyme [Lutimaribacter sp. EGI FJ00015]MCO0637126.1 aminotransferase class III-fold pyridoxal phosphate-dependent enzyme [Lutimaribacter sp. EGI FJ00014]